MGEPAPGDAAEGPEPEEVAAAVAAIERFVRDTRGAPAPDAPSIGTGSVDLA